MSTTVIVLLCSILADIIFSVFSFIIQVVLIVQNFLPTDPFGGLLDICLMLITLFLSGSVLL